LQSRDGPRLGCPKGRGDILLQAASAALGRHPRGQQRRRVFILGWEPGGRTAGVANWSKNVG